MIFSPLSLCVDVMFKESWYYKRGLDAACEGCPQQSTHGEISPSMTLHRCCLVINSSLCCL